ncbi:hypothetical protein ON010_g61 [Phytophthora cinnamomi]|nr:hypothetical protein ON010_g61 [Phytophthora cinnamomi]
MADYERGVLEFFDNCANDGDILSHAAVLRYCKKLPAFAIKEEKSQRSWAGNFIKRYKKLTPGSSGCENNNDSENDGSESDDKSMRDESGGDCECDETGHLGEMTASEDDKNFAESIGESDSAERRWERQF